MKTIIRKFFNDFKEITRYYNFLVNKTKNHEYVENTKIYKLIANKVAKKMQEYARADIEVSSAIFSFKGETLAESDNYKRMVGECFANTK